MKRRVAYTVRLEGEFTLEAEDGAMRRAMQDIADAVVLVPLFTGLKFQGASPSAIDLCHEIVSDDGFASLRSCDDEVEAGR